MLNYDNLQKIYFLDLTHAFKQTIDSIQHQLFKLNPGYQLIYLNSLDTLSLYHPSPPQLWVLVAKRFYPDMLQACFPVMKPLSQNSPVLILSAEPMNSIHINLDELSQHQLSFFPLNADYAWITSKIHELLSQQDTTRKPLQIPPEICQSIALLEKLSKRELEILGFIGQGLSNREISLELTLSEHSVRTHVYNIFTKLSLKRRSQAVLVDIYRKTNDVSA